MKTYEIYLITNTETNQRYVGQVITTKGYLKRFEEHIYESNRNGKRDQTLINKALRNYPRETFKVELIEANIPESDIDDKERFYIIKYNTYYENENGYNMTKGGRGCDGYVYDSDEFKEKISKKCKQWWDYIKKYDITEYKRMCQSRSIALKGKPKSAEHKKKLSVSASKRLGIKNAFYGKHHSTITKKKISQANSSPVGAYDISTGNLVKTFDSITQAVEFLLANGITKNKNANARISKICQGKDKTAYGYIWKYL